MSESMLDGYRRLLEDQSKEIENLQEAIRIHEKTIMGLIAVVDLMNTRLLEDSKVFDLANHTIRMQIEEIQKYRAAFGGTIKDTSKNMPN